MDLSAMLLSSSSSRGDEGHEGVWHGEKLPSYVYKSHMGLPVSGDKGIGDFDQEFYNTTFMYMWKRRVSMCVKQKASLPNFTHKNTMQFCCISDLDGSYDYTDNTDFCGEDNVAIQPRPFHFHVFVCVFKSTDITVILKSPHGFAYFDYT